MSTARQIAIAQITGLVEGHVGNRQPRVCDEQAIADIRAISTDVTVLSEAAGYFLPPTSVHPVRAGRAVALLTQAGAEAAMAGDFAHQRGLRRGFRLGAMADGLNDDGS